MFDQNFYHKLIRKYTFAFGTIFNDIYVERTDANNNVIQKIKVPLMYGGKDKQLSRWKADPEIDRMPSIILPTMSFEYGSLQYDSQRQMNPIGRITAPGANNTASVLYNAVPYNIPFNVYVYVDNTEDGTKIIETILPWFHPDLVLPIELIPEMNITQNIPISYNGSQLYSNYEGQFPIKQVVAIWTLQFTLKGFLYGPVKQKKLIRFVEGNLYVANTNTALNSITVQPGLTANGTPTNNLQESVDVHTININDDYGYVKIIT